MKEITTGLVWESRMGLEVVGSRYLERGNEGTFWRSGNALYLVWRRWFHRYIGLLNSSN